MSEPVETPRFGFLVPGRFYTVTHQQLGLQRYARESVVRFLGYNATTGVYSWDARPVAGTQDLHNQDVISVETAPGATTPVLNRRAPR